MNIKSMLLLLSLFLFSSTIHAMEENLPELPLLEEVTLLRSSTLSLLDTDAWNPTIEQKMQPIIELDEKQPTHIVKKPYICSYCSRAFKYMSPLKVHERKHTGDKPFICSYPNCGYTSTQKGALNRHKKNHTGAKPFKCDHEDCGYTCAQKFTLTTHKRTHSGEKPYLCDYSNCGHAFTQKNTLTRHKKTHTREESFVCDYPNRDYSCIQKGNLITRQRILIPRRDAAIIVATKKAKLNPPSFDSLEEKNEN